MIQFIREFGNCYSVCHMTMLSLISKRVVAHKLSTATLYQVYRAGLMVLVAFFLQCLGYSNSGNRLHYKYVVSPYTSLLCSVLALIIQTQHKPGVQCVLLTPVL